MTNEEAVKILRRIQDPEAWEPQITGTAFEALDMAIKALGRQQAAGSKDLISRQSLLAKYDEQHEGPPGRARKLIEDEPPVLGTNLAEVGTDAISRQAAIEVVQNRHMMLSKEKVLLINDLEKLPSAQPTFDARDTQYNLPIGTDLISRAEAIDALTEYGNGRAVFISVGEAVIRIEQLPPIQPKLLQPWEVLVAQAVLPQPKRGKWICTGIMEEAYAMEYRCSVCGSTDFGGDYCSNCGAKMENDEDETD